MATRLLTLTLIAATFLSAQKEDKTRKDSAPKAKVEALAGCVDERGETYVLVGDVRLKVIAKLKGRAFSDDNFARYVGHKVTVHGELKQDGEDKVLYVTKIDDGGLGCSPEPAKP